MKLRMLGLLGVMASGNAALAADADAIYFGGPIVTVNDRAPMAEAVAVKDGKIIMVGKKAAVFRAEKGKITQLRDLKGQTMTPGFIDPHSHFIDSLSISDRVNVSAPPVGPAANPIEITAALQAAAKARGLKAGELLLGYGYDENLMPAGEPLSRDALDKAFPDNPVAVIHVSMHGAVLNSAAFSKFGYKDGMPTPAGGVMLRKGDTQDLQGLVMETAYLPMLSNLPGPTPETEVAAAKAGQMLYAAAQGDYHQCRLSIPRGGEQRFDRGRQTRRSRRAFRKSLDREADGDSGHQGPGDDQGWQDYLPGNQIYWPVCFRRPIRIGHNGVAKLFLFITP